MRYKMSNSNKFYISLPVTDLQRSKYFYKQLGFEFVPQLTNEFAACVIVGKDMYVMPMLPSFYSHALDEQTSKTVQDTKVMLSLSVESKAAVDEMVKKALKAGAKLASPVKEQGFMVGGTFHDPDGHLWTVYYTDHSFM